MVASRKRKLETTATPVPAKNNQTNKQTNKPANKQTKKQIIQPKVAEPEPIADESDDEQSINESMNNQSDDESFDGFDESVVDSDDDIQFTESNDSLQGQSIDTDIDCPVRIFVGTYTGALYGLESLATVRELIGENDEVQIDESNEQTTNQSANNTNNQSLLTLFVTDAHRGSIRSVAVSKNHAWLVSSGLDETIQLFDLNRLKQSGSLHRHSADVNQLVFPTPCTFLSSCADGSIGVWSGAHRWECTGTLKGHKGAIDAMSVHPSGKVLLTSGSDETTRMFDLLAGRLLTTRHRRKEQKSIIDGGSGRIAELSCIDWCDAATHYAQGVDRQITVFDTEGQTVSDTNVLKSRALCMRFLSLDCLVVGCEDGSLVIVDAAKGTIKQIIKEHKARVRCCERLRVASGDGSDVVLLVTASTDGQIFVWDFTALCTKDSTANESIKPIARAKSEARITSVSVALQYQPRHHVPLTAAAVAKQPVVAKIAPVVVPVGEQKKVNKKQRTEDIKVAKQKPEVEQKKGYFPVSNKHVKAKKPAPTPAGKSGSKKPAKGGVKVSMHKKRTK